MSCWYLAYSATVVTLFELSHFHTCLPLTTSEFSSTACFICDTTANSSAGGVFLKKMCVSHLFPDFHLVVGASLYQTLTGKQTEIWGEREGVKNMFFSKPRCVCMYLG